MGSINDTVFMNVLLSIRYPLYTSYIIFGAPAILTNITMFAVLFSETKLLLKSAMIAGLAGGNLFNGLHAFGSGVYRMPLLLQNKLNLPQSIYVCMASLLPTCMLLGYSIPVAMQFAIGLERLLAIAAFKWYRVNWSPKKSWYAVGAVYALSICSWVIPAWCQVFSSYRLVTKECSSSLVINQIFFSCLIRFISVSGISGVVCVLVAVIIGRLRFGKIATSENANMNHFKKQFRLTKMMLIVVLFDFIFVVLPNICVDLQRAYSVAIPAFVSYASTATYCCNSITNIFVYVGMNLEFRKVVLKKIRDIMPKVCGFNNVLPIKNSMPRA